MQGISWRGTNNLPLPVRLQICKPCKGPGEFKETSLHSRLQASTSLNLLSCSCHSKGGRCLGRGLRLFECSADAMAGR